MLADHFGGLPSVVVEPGVRTGVPVLTDNPREVGTDRIVNALAAATRYGGPAVVVDFGGTATTFDVVNSQGQYVGGAISRASRYRWRRWNGAAPNCAWSNCVVPAP
jgi:type III pantothenate kinase